MSESSSQSALQAVPDANSIAPADWPERAIENPAGRRRDGFQVVMRQSVLDAIQAHGRTTTKLEVAGVLIGEVYRDDFGPYLLIHASLTADSTRSDAAHVTFTGATWTHIHEQMDAKFPNERIVGWYHTHPDFGIFLSEMDLFIQRNFFDLPWQVAFVYDPVRGDQGMFVWRAGDAKREDILIERDTGEPPSADVALKLSDQSAADLSPVASLTTAVFQSDNRGWFWSILVMFVAVLAAAIALVEWLDRWGRLASG